MRFSVKKPRYELEFPIEESVERNSITLTGSKVEFALLSIELEAVAEKPAIERLASALKLLVEIL